jgi:hypothetical protein
LTPTGISAGTALEIVVSGTGVSGSGSVAIGP